MKKIHRKKRRNFKSSSKSAAEKYILLAASILTVITGITGNCADTPEKQSVSAELISPIPSPLDITLSPTVSPTPTPKPLSAQDILTKARLDAQIPTTVIDTLQNALNRNPEIEPFVKYYFTAKPKATGGLKEEEKNQKNPLFIQWDKRWGYVPYGDNTIGLSGCAPTCLSMVLFSLTRDENATPDALASYSTEKGYYVHGTGTAWELMTDIPAQYPVTATEVTPSETAITEHLRTDGQLICSMGPGDFTDTGHFIVIYGIQNHAFLVNDPFSHSNSEKTWTYTELAPQINNIWAYHLK